MNTYKELKMALALTAALASLVCGCSVKEDPGTAQLNHDLAQLPPVVPPTPVNADQSVDGTPTCAERTQDMTSMNAESQSLIEAAYHQAFSGGGGGQSTQDLKAEADAFRVKYASLTCDGETNDTFLAEIKVATDEVDQMQLN